jgi:hypothetical protein
MLMLLLLAAAAAAAAAQTWLDCENASHVANIVLVSHDHCCSADGLLLLMLTFAAT